MSSEERTELGTLFLSQPEPLIPTAPPLSSSLSPMNISMAVTNNQRTIFGEILERDVTFCVDTSGSMFNSLHVVKEHLIEALVNHAQREGDTTFNIIEFNSEITQWSDKMVSCTAETVKVAADWIRKLSAKTGSNTLDALLTALQDSTCQAVYLVTDGLPDTFAEDILDTVISVTNGRPIHCIYLMGEKADTAAVEFLEDLAVESFGSFHIISLTSHGCVERVIPVYRAEHASERVIRTVNNTLRPNLKTCSVTTTLQIDPDDILGIAPRTASLGMHCYPSFMPPWWSWRYWGLGMFPYRYYFPSTWCRYRPAKSWLRVQDKLAEVPDNLGLSPSAGALLIGKKVLARRIADGYFYMGTIQSQILEDKFLVAFGPCKHGKYRETTYQDTFIFDIVDYWDAQRHTIITGDHVLAPWEPEGERYGPGIVIDGQEKRQAIGSDDHQLTVAFSNGRTEKVALEKAIWVPQPVYARVSLELKMPQETRSTIMTIDHYPHHTLPGYPSSGPVATPSDYYMPENFTIEPNIIHGGWDRWVYPEYLGYYPPYPLVLRKKQTQKEIDLPPENEDALIPGTDMTKKQLHSRIQSQLSEHSPAHSHLSSDARQQGQLNQDSGYLLKKREKLEENSLKKSVKFSDTDLVQVAPERGFKSAMSDADSGFASSPELDVASVSQEQLDRLEEERYKIAEEKYLIEEERRLLEDPRLQFYRSPGLGKRPSWKYWRNDPCPSLSNSYGGYNGDGYGVKSDPGLFRETALQAPLEARDQRRTPYIVEWTSPNFKYVDTFAKHDRTNTVEGCLKTPHPPSAAQRDGRDIYSSVSRPPTEEEKAEAKRAYKQKRFKQRQMAWQERLQNDDRMKTLMQDGHRERILAQIAREMERQEKEQEMISKAREAKKKISREIQAHIEENQQREKERDENRINAMKQRREHRESIERQCQKDFEETVKRREEIQRQHCVARHNAITAKLEDEEARNNVVSNQHRNAKLNRVQHFHNLEDQAQAKKDLRVAVTDQHLALYRSQIFP